MKAVRRSILSGLAIAAVSAPVAAQSYPGAEAATRASFGGAVAVAGDQVLVGEPDTRIRPGTVYIYEMRDGAWTEAGRLTAPDGEADDGFGTALVASGGTLLVSSADAVHVFERDGDRWVPRTRLSVEDVQEDDDFGATLALSGELALVGAPGRSEGAGAVHVFRRAEGTWSRAGVLEPEATDAGTRFGEALALGEGVAVVGAPRAGDRAGVVYAFGLGAGGDIARLARIQPEGLRRNDQFGAAVAVHDGLVFVGAPYIAGQMGSVVMFETDGESGWQPVGQLIPFDGMGRTGFGSTLAVADGRVWVGAPRAGAAYVFWRDGASWAGSRRLAPSSAEGGFASTIGFAGGDVVAFGMPGADYGAGQASIFVQGPDGDWTESERVMSGVETLEAVTGENVACSPDGEAAHFECGDVDLLAFLPVTEMGAGRGVRVNDVWGWVDPETNREYALVGMTDQAAFVDITNPNAPAYLGRLPMTEGARGSAWRDIKVYGSHAFIVSDGAGQHGMQVFDLTRLRDVSGEPVTFEADALYDRIASAHNIVVNTETGFAYAVGASSGGETCGGGLHMIDVRDPENPTFAGCFADPQTGRASTGYSHDAMCITYHGPDEEYQGREICFGANETAISIADVTDKASPVALSRASYPNVAYSHQGWIDEEHRYFYLDDELDEIQGSAPRTRTMIWDVTDLEDPQLVGEFLGTTESSDHNLYILGDLMYQSNYQSGLRIIDISDRENPAEVGFFDTVPYGTNTPGFGGSWSNYPYFPSGNVIVTSGNEGLFIVKPQVTRTVS